MTETQSTGPTWRAYDTASRRARGGGLVALPYGEQAQGH